MFKGTAPLPACYDPFATRKDYPNTGAALPTHRPGRLNLDWNRLLGPLMDCFALFVDEKKYINYEAERPGWAIAMYGTGIWRKFFSGRLFVTWFLSRKAQAHHHPFLFWKLSLLASFLLFVYCHLRNDFAIMLGQSLPISSPRAEPAPRGEWQKSPWWFEPFTDIPLSSSSSTGTTTANTISMPCSTMRTSPIGSCGWGWLPRYCLPFGSSTNGSIRNGKISHLPWVSGDWVP